MSDGENKDAITYAGEANENLGYVKVLVDEEGKRVEKSLLSTQEGTTILNKYESGLKDGLTGLLKPNVWKEEAKRFFEYISRNNGKFGILYIDINDFKRYNDDISHEFGDEVIRMVADSIRKSTREADVDGRVGGDEFAVALPDADNNILTEVRDRITSKLLDLSLNSETMLKRNVKPTVTIGLCASSSVSNTFESVLLAADQDMLKLKKKNKYGR